MDINIKLETLINTPSDINEHLNTLVEYSKECDHITEMGVRWVVSTWAFLSATPKKLISYDIQHPSKWGANLNDIYFAANDLNVEYSFHLANVLEIDIEQTDLLFLDTWHSYKQLKAELRKHNSKVNKYIVMHDTSNYEFKDEEGYESLGFHSNTESKYGLWPAIEEFLENNKQWELHKRYNNNNGLTILKRI
jgi:hypothetical protein